MPQSETLSQKWGGVRDETICITSVDVYSHHQSTLEHFRCHLQKKKLTSIAITLPSVLPSPLGNRQSSFRPSRFACSGHFTQIESSDKWYLGLPV